MLVSIALMLYSKSMPLLCGFVFFEAGIVFVLVFAIGQHHRGKGVRQVDSQQAEPAPPDSDNAPPSTDRA
jgi:hypothetical protein